MLHIASFLVTSIFPQYYKLPQWRLGNYRYLICYQDRDMKMISRIGAILNRSRRFHFHHGLMSSKLSHTFLTRLYASIWAEVTWGSWDSLNSHQPHASLSHFILMLLISIFSFHLLDNIYRFITLIRLPFFHSHRCLAFMASMIAKR